MLVALIGAVMSAGLGLAAAPFDVLLRGLPLATQLWLVGGVVAAAGVLGALVLLRRRLRPQRVGGLKLGLWALGGAGLSLLVSAIVPVLLAEERCPVPAELRLVTAPETVGALMGRAQRYVRENLRDGCPLVRVTVAPAPPPVHLEDAFSNDWEWNEDRRDQPYARLYDLQPDAWVATTRAEPDELRNNGHKTIGPPELQVGRDQLVLAMTERRRDELGRHMDDPAAYSLGEVWDVLTDKMDMSVARPFPETSVAALIATGDVFDRALRARPDREPESGLVSAGLGADTVPSLLCSFGRLADEVPPPVSGGASRGGAGAIADPKVVLLVPGHSVDDYNAGRVAGCPGETGDGLDLVAVRHRELSTLDYRYVKVMWQGQRSAAREAIVDHFGAWLSRNPLFPGIQVSSEITVDGESLGELRTRLLDELRPRLDLRVLVDTSGSADRPVRVQAAEALRAQSRMLGPRDHLQVFGLHSVAPDGAAEVTELTGRSQLGGRSERDRLGTVATTIEHTPFDQWDAPVSAALGKLGDGDEAVAAPVVVLTDGRLFDNEGPAAPEVLAGALQDADAVSGLYVVVFGQDRCGVSELRAAKPYRCVTAGASAEEAITRAIITVREWR
ncbi:hypothetical protein C1J01_34270 [Nonomuraea aridisoli]|uniref:VWA domain-containing protein n=2 Tax=Nonomuraea aridisoli TaxID=2070368 RepID=A0A2W2DIU2_9ACTN|nr:hypothetical protein C1J01_34270 [Nonomuraea aridisoli]